MARVICPNCKSQFDIMNHDSGWVNGFHDSTNNVIGELKAAEIRNENGDKAMNDNELMNILKGIMTDEQLAVLSIRLAEEKDSTVKKIVDETPFIRNADFDLQHITAMTFRLLNGEGGWTAAIKRRYNFDYAMKFLLTITHRIAKLEKENPKMFEVELNFFNKNVICETLDAYAKILSRYLSKQPVHRCEGRPYIKVGTRHFCDKLYEHDKCGCMFISNLDKVFVAPVLAIVEQIKRASTYAEIEKLLKQVFNPKIYWALRVSVDFCKEWLNAYKGRGAFFTLQNIIRHSGVRIEKNYKIGISEMYDMYDSLAYVGQYLKDCNGEYYKLLGLLKKTIEVNKFDFNKLMSDKYGN